MERSSATAVSLFRHNQEACHAVEQLLLRESRIAFAQLKSDYMDNIGMARQTA